jgi:hypothetical protein
MFWFVGMFNGKAAKYIAGLSCQVDYTDAEGAATSRNV